MNIINKLSEYGRKNIEHFIREGTQPFQEAVLIKDNELIGAVRMLYENEKEKRQAYKFVGKTCSEKGIDQVAILCDATMRPTVDSEDRTDCLVISYIDFKDFDNTKSVLVPYEIKGKFVDFATFNAPENSTIGGQILGCVLVGFATYKSFEIAQSSTSLDEAGKKFKESYFKNLESHPEIQDSIGMGFGE